MSAAILTELCHSFDSFVSICVSHCKCDFKIQIISTFRVNVKDSRKGVDVVCSANDDALGHFANDCTFCLAFHLRRRHFSRTALLRTLYFCCSPMVSVPHGPLKPKNFNKMLVAGYEAFQNIIDF